MSHPTDLNTSIPFHSTGPEQDHRARLNVAGTMHASGHTHEEIAQVLEILGLLPGQETERQPQLLELTREVSPRCSTANRP